MDIILLPILEQTTSPRDALKIMKESRRSVSVVVGSPPLGLISSVELRKAKNQKQTSLHEAQLEALTVLFDGDFMPEGYAALKLPDHIYPLVRQHLIQTFPGLPHRQLSVPASDLSAFENLLPPNAMHGYLGYDRGAAVVITRHETLAAQASGPPPDCCCGNPQTPHEYPAGRKRTGQACDNCSYTVEC